MMMISICMMLNDFRNAWQLLRYFYKLVSTIIYYVMHLVPPGHDKKCFCQHDKSEAVKVG